MCVYCVPCTTPNPLSSTTYSKHCCLQWPVHTGFDQRRWRAAWQCLTVGLQCITSCFLPRGRTSLGLMHVQPGNESRHLWGCLWRVGDEGQYVNASSFIHGADGFDIHFMRLLSSSTWRERGPRPWPPDAFLSCFLPLCYSCSLDSCSQINFLTARSTACRLCSQGNPDREAKGWLSPLSINRVTISSTQGLNLSITDWLQITARIGPSWQREKSGDGVVWK